MTLNIETLKAQTAKAARRCEAWMLGHIKNGNLYGSEHPDPVSYYKWPLTLMARGQHAEAERLLNWINDRCLQDNGDYVSNRSGFHKEFHTYATLWMVLAAIRLNDRELVQKQLGFVLRYFNRKTGGLATFPAGSEHLTEDLCSTAFLGMVACDMKDKDLADLILGYFKTILALQDGNKKIWIRLKTDGTLAQSVPVEADPKTYCIRIGNEDECYYFLGAACYFFARYTETFGDGALALSEKYADIIEQVGSEALRTIWAAKVSPGCASLYGVTSDERFLKLAHPVLTTVLELQMPGGYWLKNGMPWITVSAEQCFWLTDIHERLDKGTIQ